MPGKKRRPADAATNGQKDGRPPREDLFRATYPGVEFREATDGEAPILTGHFAIFNEWTEIDSMWEGRFMERISPGAFRKTFKEARHSIRVLFQHGRDPQVGDKPLAKITDLREDGTGAFYEASMLDTAYNQDILPGLEAGLYGASFRFRVLKEEFDEKAKRSSYNPEGLPERTITEAAVREFGPVTFPAYAGATAGVRSLTDRYKFGEEAEIVKAVLEQHAADRSSETPPEVPPPEDAALSSDGAEEAHSDEGSRETLSDDGAGADHSDTESRGGDDPAVLSQPTTEKEITAMTVEEKRARQNEILARQTELNTGEFADSALPEAERKEFETLEAEWAALEKDITEVEERRAKLERKSAEPTSRVDPVGGFNVRVSSDPFDLSTMRVRGDNPESLDREYRDRALKVTENIRSIPHPDVKLEDAQERISELIESGVRDVDDRNFARRVIVTMNPAYQRGLNKYLAGASLTTEERTQLDLSAAAYALPVTLDPTIIQASNGAVNPFRQISRVVTSSGTTWEGVTSAGITASYDAEATETDDDKPTLGQVQISAEKAQAFVPFTIEAGQDWAGLVSSMAVEFADAKDALEATKFAIGAGSGSNEPFGVLTGATTTVDTAADNTFAIADLFTLEAALPPRFRANASIVANRAVYQKIRQFDTSGGAGLWMRIGDGLRNNNTGALGSALLGYPTYECSTMSALTTTGDENIAIIGDFRNYVILDKIGMNVELIPHLFGTARNFPNGTRGLYCYWRNSAKVATANAFRVLKVNSTW